MDYRSFLFPVLLIFIPLCGLLLSTLYDDVGSKIWKYNIKPVKVIKLKPIYRFFFGMKSYRDNTITAQLVFRNILGFGFLLLGIIFTIIYLVMPPRTDVGIFVWILISFLVVTIIVFILFSNVFFSYLNSKEKEDIIYRENCFTELLDKILIKVVELEKTLQFNAKNEKCTFRPYHEINIVIDKNQIKLIVRYSTDSNLSIAIFVNNGGVEEKYEVYTEKNNLIYYDIDNADISCQLDMLELIITGIISSFKEPITHATNT